MNVGEVADRSMGTVRSIKVIMIHPLGQLQKMESQR